MLLLSGNNSQTLQYKINGINDRVPRIRLRYDRDPGRCCSGLSFPIIKMETIVVSLELCKVISYFEKKVS